MALACGTGSSFGLQHRSKNVAFKRASTSQTVARVASIGREIPVDFMPGSLLRPGVDNSSTKARFEKIVRDGQDAICKAISEIDGKEFRTDAWTREGGGGGITKVLQDGNVWEKAGVAVSVIYGSMPPEVYRGAIGTDALKNNDGSRVPFFACGVSSVMHPRNPHCPTMHFNYRYFETEEWNGIPGQWWFGGGTDITPSYVDAEDMKHFHGTYKNICDKHDPAYYDKFRKWCDEYFLIKHRGERRGLGGIFYDDLNDRPQEEIMNFSEECLNNVPTAYCPIIKKHMNDSFTEQEKRWQQLRRGRYVEFNLIYDRGTIFGLKTGAGRVESMLMSTPLTARWEYDMHPEAGSPEAEFLDAARNPRVWV